MAMPARKLNFEDISSAITSLTPAEKETLEIMLQEDLYRELLRRRKEFREELGRGEGQSIQEVLREIEND